MHIGKLVLPKAQRGVSLTGLIVVLVIVGLFFILIAKTLPSYLEYRSVREGIVRAKAAGGTVAEMEATFNKFAEINSVQAVRGRDLVITRDSGKPELSFAYEKRIPLTEHVSIVIDYDGTTDPSGVVAASSQ